MRRHRLHLLAAALGALAGAACLARDTVGGLDLGGSTLTALPATVLADGHDAADLTVCLRRGDGAPVVGAAVQLAAGDVAIVQPPPTGADGCSRGSGTALRAGSRAVEAALLYGGHVLPLPLSAQVSFAAPSPAAPTAGADSIMAVVVRDASGALDGSYRGTVQLVCSDSRALLPAPVSFTAADGGHRIVGPLQLRTAGVQTVQALEVPSGRLLATATFTVGPGPLAGFAVSGPGAVVAGEAHDFVAVALDTFGNLAADAGGVVQPTSTDPLARLPAAAPYVADAAAGGGSLLLAVRFGAAGAQQLLVADQDSPQLQGSVAVQVLPAAATQLQLDTAAAAPVGQAQAVQLSARDPFGNVDVGFVGTVALQTSDGRADLTAQVALPAAAQGSAAVPGGVLWRTAGTQGIAAAAAGGGPVGQAAGVRVAPGPVAALALTAPAGAVAGAYAPMALLAQDRFGNVATTYAGAVRLACSDGRAGLPTGHVFGSADAGAFRFDAILRTAGAQSVQGVDTSNPALAAAASVAVGPAAAADIALAGLPSTVVAGTPVAVTAQVVDAFGNPEPTWQGTLQLAATDPQAGTGGAAAVGAGDGGAHTFAVILRTAGATTVSALSAGAAAGLAGTAPAVQVRPAAAAQLAVVVSPAAAQGACAGLSPAPAVALQDAFGNGVTQAGQVAVSLLPAAAPPPPRQGLGGARVQPLGADGTTTFAGLHVDAPGTYRLQATASGGLSGVAAGASGPFTVAPAAPPTLTLDSVGSGGGAPQAACVPVAFHVASACPVTVALEVDPGSGVFAAAPAAPPVAGSSGGVQLRPGAAGAAYSLGWDSTQSFAGASPPAAQLRLRAVSAGQTATVAAPLMVANGLTLAAPRPLLAGLGCVAGADLDGDGRPDVVGCGAAGGVVVARGDGQGSVGAAATQAAPALVDLTVLDFDRDGRADVVGLGADGNVVVLFGQGGGALGAAQIYAGAAGAGALLAADLDQDGWADVALAGPTGATVLHQVPSSHALAAATGGSVGGGLIALARIDANRDGRPDLVGSAGSSAYVLLGKAAGGYQAATALPLGSAAQGRALAVADLDGDGRDDVVVGTAAGLGWLRGDGQGNFARADVALPAAATAVAVADLDARGGPEVVAACGTSLRALGLRGGPLTTLAQVPLAAPARAVRPLDLTRRGRPQVLALAADGSLGAVPNATPPRCQVGLVGARSARLPYTPSGAASADMQGDGRADLVVASASFGLITVALGDGAGGFAPAASYRAGRGVGPPAAGDLDGDGVADVVRTDSTAAAAQVWRNDGHGALTALPPVATVAAPQAPQLLDVDGDGVDDVVVAGAGGAVQVLHNRGDGVLTAQPPQPLATNLVDLAAVDLDGDGLPELVAASAADANVLTLWRQGGGLVLGAAASTCGGASGLLVGDADGDGAPDVGVLCPGAGTATLLHNDGHGHLAAWQSLSTAAQLAALLDVSGDGRADLAGLGGGQLSLALSGGNTFAAPQFTAAQPQGRALLAVDLDGDGRRDLVALDAPGQLRYATSWHNGGQGSLARPPLVGGTYAHVVLADLDRDGALDVAQVTDQALVVRRGDGAGGLAAPVSSAVGPAPFTVAVGDLNNDGWPDVATSSSTKGKAAVLRNRADGTGALGAATYYDWTPAANDPNLSGPCSLFLHDINRDGAVDAVFTQFSGFSLNAVLGDGTGNMGAPMALGAYIEPFRNLGVGDVNGDGIDDVVDSEEAVSAIGAALLTAGGTASGVSTLVDSGVDSIAVDLGDFDRDGQLDIVFVDGSNLVLATGNGRGGTTASRAVGVAEGGMATVAAVDLDRDGCLDAVTHTGSDASVVLLRGDCAGGLLSPAYVVSGVVGVPVLHNEIVTYGLSRVAPGDLNGDGLADVVVSGAPGSPSGGGIDVLLAH